MPYLMRRLVVDGFQLRGTFIIINKYLDGFDTGEVSIPNFSHYGSNDEEIAIRFRANYQNEQVKQKAVGLLIQLVDDGDINEYLPRDDWENIENTSPVDRNACSKAFQCASAISQIEAFENIDQTHSINGYFPICFFHTLFTNLGINDRLLPQDITDYCGQDVQNIVAPSIAAIEDVDLVAEDFYNHNFFERFVHMFCDNLLITRNSEAAFWNLFYVRNAPWLFLNDCRQRFCEKLSE